MGTLIRFPRERCAARATWHARERLEATIIILPVIRIERMPDDPSGLEPDASATAGRKRRRRASRP